MEQFFHVLFNTGHETPNLTVLVVLIVLALVLPPLWACWRALPPGRRGWMLPAALLLPMLPLLGVPAIDAAVYGDWIHGRVVLLAALGVPYSVWAAEIGVLLLLCFGLGMQSAWRDADPR